jgi:nucleoside-diphosphate-sugar epimerase
MKTKIFITGVTGFIGRHLLEELSHSKDNYCMCLVRDLDKGVLLKKDNIDYITVDQTNNYSKYISDCDYVVHLAAELDSKSPKIYSSNVGLTKSLLKQCVGNSLKKFVFLSSTTVTRADKLPYQKSKKTAEDLVVSSGLPFLIVRSPWVLGYDSPSVINFINYLNKFPIVPIIGSGKSLTQPIFIKDLVLILIKCIFSEDEKNKIVEVGGLSPVSYNDFIDYFMQKLHLRKLKVHLPIWACQLIAKYTKILSTDVISDFSNDTKIDIAGIVNKYNFRPLDYKKMIDIIVGSKI